ncbi:MAG: hypothetical protein H0V30_05975 [Chitinophagaceae bacterium]|nr:hypothetical protein [Chitinophagaceae bacterium]
MKKTFLLLAFVTATLFSFSQDAALNARLNSFIKANDAMDLDKILDFTYPKIFTLAPREKLKEALNESFNGEDVTVKMDSLQILKIFPVFTVEDGTFAKIKYSFVMFMTFKEAEDQETRQEENEFMLSLMGETYGKNNVSYDPVSKAIRIKVNSEMAAIKDKYAKEWCFMDMVNNKAMNEKMLDKTILDKLATYH